MIAINGRVVACGLLLLFLATAASRAGTVTDDFSTSHDYLNAGVAGTLWDGLYTGAGSVPGYSVGRPTGQQVIGPGSTLKADANLTGTNLLTVLSVQTDWENPDDDGFFLYQNVTGDFQVSVHVVSPYDNRTYNTAGLMARAAGPDGAPYGGAENWVSLTRFDQFGFANYPRNTINGVTAQIDPFDSPNTNYWLMLERVKGTNFNFYQKAQQTDAWQLIAMVTNPPVTRPDLAGLPLQVGIIHATFGDTPLQAQFEHFTLTGPNVNTNATPPPPASGLMVTPAGSNSLALTWTPGLGSAGSLVMVRSGFPTSRQPTSGTTYSAGAAFGSGANLGESNYVVSAGSGGSVTMSNLTPGMIYYAAVYAYSGTGAAISYNLSTPAASSQFGPGTLQDVSLRVDPKIDLGDCGRAVVTADYGSGNDFDVSRLSAYSSSATNVIAVSSNGTLHALAYGSAVVTAMYQGRQDSQPVVVVNPLTDALTHRYGFAADAGDSVGIADGVLQGGVSISSGALVLDGVSGYLDLPNNLLTNYASVTMEAWFTDFGSKKWARIFDFGNNTGGEGAQGVGTQYMFLSLPANKGNLRGACTTNLDPNNAIATEQRIDLPVPNRPPVGQRAHVVWTLDSVAHEGRLYVNGVLVGLNTEMTFTPADMGPTVNNWLGRSQFTGDHYFYGTIDEFRIYNMALGSNAVYQSYAAGPDLALPALTGMVLTPSSQTIGAGTNQQFTATGYYSDGSSGVLTARGQVTWGSTDPTVATADTNGLVVGLKAGTATIVAIAGGVSAEAALTVVERPMISTQPANTTASANGTITLSVRAQGGVLGYQWQFNRTNILGATNATLTLAGLGLNQAGLYSVMVSNLAGTTASTPAALSFLTLNQFAGTSQTYAELTIVGQVGGAYEIDYLNNITDTNWSVLATLVLPVSPYPFIDVNSPGFSRRFYRAVLLP